MCGIFAFVNSNVAVERRKLISNLVTGLRRLEYRGYDSAGISVSFAGASGRAHIYRQKGNIDCLQKLIDERVVADNVELDGVETDHIGVAHTRWATHGPPSDYNSHPHVSDEKQSFTVVHNGIITNYKTLKEMLQRHRFIFTSDTDTEVIAVLCKFIFDQLVRATGAKPTFLEVVSEMMAHVEGAFACVLKSRLYPNECIACKRGSPLLVGIVAVDNGDLLRTGSTFALNDCPKTPISGSLELPPAAAAAAPSEHKLFRNTTISEHAFNLLDQAPETPTVSPDPAPFADCDHLSSQSERSNSISPSSAASASSGEAAAARVEPADIDGMESKDSNKETYTDRYGVRAKKGVFLFASDPSAIVEHTRKVIIMEDDEIVHLFHGHMKLYNANKALAAGAPAKTKVLEEIEMEMEQIMKGNFAHFMLKEIHEQRDSVMNTMRGRVNFATNEVTLGGVANFIHDIRRSNRLVFIACGTSLNAAIATRPIVEELAGIPVTIENASDFNDREAPVFRSDTCFFISQSGETADTLSALKHAKRLGALCVGITNTVGSAIARHTDCGIHVNAGVEIGVASTKAYTSQVIAITLLALMLSQDKMSLGARRAAIIQDLQRLPSLIDEVLREEHKMKELADELVDARSLLLMGRGYQFATVVEGALKIKEVAYLHTEGLLSGELKHGPLALVDENMPVMLICVQDRQYEKAKLAVAQVRARNARPIVIANAGDADAAKDATTVITVPRAVDCLQGILCVIPMQLLSYHLAVRRGHNVDQPRNLAKSVTTH